MSEDEQAAPTSTVVFRLNGELAVEVLVLPDGLLRVEWWTEPLARDWEPMILMPGENRIVEDHAEPTEATGSLPDIVVQRVWIDGVPIEASDPRWSTTANSVTDLVLGTGHQIADGTGTVRVPLVTADVPTEDPEPRPSLWVGTSYQPGLMPPGSICETCFDAPAVRDVEAPWGGMMGICIACARKALIPPIEAASCIRPMNEIL